ncbi:MAG: ATPase domain-containing protein [Candidatus Micrarchaeia archaeon]
MVGSGSSGVIRVPTGIPGLDERIEGGIPEKSAVVVMGPPGSGKTIFTAQIAKTACEKGEKAVIVLVGQSREQFLHDMSRFQWGLNDFENRGVLKIFEQDAIRADFDESFVTLCGSLKEFDPSRVVIDSFSLLLQANEADSQKRMRMIRTIDLLANNSVLFLTMEKTGTETHMPLEFAADSILNITRNVHEGAIIRRLEIHKMRRTSIVPVSTCLKISEKGILLFSEPVTSFSEEASLRKTKLGVPGLDALIGGSIFEGSTGILNGTSGTGKTLLGLHFLMEGAKNNETGLYVSFEEGESQLLRNAAILGWDFESLKKSGLISFYCHPPETRQAEEHLASIISAVTTTAEKRGAKRVVVDSIYAIQLEYGKRATHFVKTLVLALKNRGITALFIDKTATLTGAMDDTSLHISSLADYIVMLKQIEAYGELKKMLVVLKARGCDPDKAMWAYRIKTGGMVVDSKFEGFIGLLNGIATKSSEERRVDALAGR